MRRFLALFACFIFMIVPSYAKETKEINALKHEWKDKTRENISDCNVINKENYIEKYKNDKKQ